MIVRAFLASAAMSAASAAIAAAPADQPASEGAAAARAPADSAAEKKICRTEKATGSLTRRTRICMTAAQWREINDRTRRGVGEMQNSASGSQVCQYEDPNRTSPCY